MESHNPQKTQNIIKDITTTELSSYPVNTLKIDPLPPHNFDPFPHVNIDPSSHFNFDPLDGYHLL